MIKITSNSWKGLFDKIVVFREFLNEFNVSKSEISTIETKGISEDRSSEYFICDEYEYIF